MTIPLNQSIENVISPAQCKPSPAYSSTCRNNSYILLKLADVIYFLDLAPPRTKKERGVDVHVFHRAASLLAVTKTTTTVCHPHHIWLLSVYLFFFLLLCSPSNSVGQELVEVSHSAILFVLWPSQLCNR